MPRFRTGHRVRLNVYDNDEPAFQAHSEHKAAVYVALLNAGERVETITRAELHELFDHSEQWWGEEDFLDRLERAVWRLFIFIAPDTPLSTPESPSEPPAATGRPADDSGPPPSECVRCSHHRGSHRGTVGEGDPLTHCRAPGCGCNQFEEW